MRLGQEGAHLTYCLNVHPAETWIDTFESIRTYALRVRDAVGCDSAFGLGLRISYKAAVTLEDPAKLNEFKEFLSEHGLYVFTINGFPFGPFHGQPVKEAVYKPDWRASERLDYTLRLADILEQLLPDGVSGSISTVPCAYKTWINGEEDIALVTENLIKCVRHLESIKERTGKELHIGLEPEPDCYLETTDEVIEFFNREELRGENVRRHLGVCFDTCHLAVGFENIEDSLAKLAAEGIRISKIQLSSALKIKVDGKTASVLEQFNDPVYLHQVKGIDADGRITVWADLPELFKALPADIQECRVHCHVPLYFEGNSEIFSTSSELTPSFFAKVKECGVEHLEIETYTFNVLPDELKSRGVVRSIADEYDFVMKLCSGAE